MKDDYFFVVECYVSFFMVAWSIVGSILHILISIQVYIFWFALGSYVKY